MLILFIWAKEAVFRSLWNWSDFRHLPLKRVASHNCIYSYICSHLYFFFFKHVFLLETPTLTHETFKALKPGLSAYADDVEKVMIFSQVYLFFRFVFQLGNLLKPTRFLECVDLCRGKRL